MQLDLKRSDHIVEAGETLGFHLGAEHQQVQVETIRGIDGEFRPVFGQDGESPGDKVDALHRSFHFYFLFRNLSEGGDHCSESHDHHYYRPQEYFFQHVLPPIQSSQTMVAL